MTVRPRTRKWEAAYFAALERTGDPTIAAGRAGKSRSVVYYHRKKAEFAERWDAALEVYAQKAARIAVLCL